MKASGALLSIGAIAAVLALLGACKPSPSAPSSGTLKVTLVSLGQRPADVDWFGVVISPNRGHVAWVLKKLGKEVAVIDGKEGPPFDTIGRPAFSPDSTRIAYLAVRSGKCVSVVDGVESGQTYDRASFSDPVQFSADSGHYGFVAWRDGKVMLVRDGREGPAFACPPAGEPPIVSADLTRFAYRAVLPTGEHVAIIDGKPGKAYEWVTDLQFSPDSRRVIYFVTANGHQRAVVDGEESAPYKSIRSFSASFSPDSQRVAFVAIDDKRAEQVVVDGVAGKLYDRTELENTVFSPDSRHTVYVAVISDDRCVIADGKEGPRYRSLFWDPIYSPDGRHMIYAGVPAGGERQVVFDGAPVDTCNSLTRPVFSPDSRHWAYAKSSGGKQFLIHDGASIADFAWSDVDRTQVFFSPDSSRLAWNVTKPGLGGSVVIDGVVRDYTGFSRDCPIFSPDSKHVAYWSSNYGTRLYVDNAAVDLPPFVPNTCPVFDSTTRLNALVVEGDRISRAEIEVLP